MVRKRIKEEEKYLGNESSGEDLRKRSKIRLVFRARSEESELWFIIFAG
jgi:hypothetical protein